jgi:hypothetical protein
VAADLPYRGTFGQRRPAAMSGLKLPPERMPAHDRRRPLKTWRYLGVFGPQVMLCIGSVRVGPIRQSFWAVWDRDRLYEHTLVGRREVRLSRGRAEVHSREVRIELELEETSGVETVSPSGESYAWTRKQGGVPARGVVTIRGRALDLLAPAIIDDSAGYHERHTRWRWCAGVGRSLDGRELAWNLVDGVHDAPVSSERSVWVDGEPREVEPCTFDPDLRGVDSLHFEPEAMRQRRDNLLLLRSAYRQPFGTFSGELPGGVRLGEGYGVMEAHDAWW